MDETTFSIRLSRLREKKGVSARKMSLDIAQNPGYINNIETKHLFPSLPAFFLICEYLDITPQDFFNLENENPEKICSITNNLKVLSPKQLDAVAILVEELANTHK